MPHPKATAVPQLYKAIYQDIIKKASVRFRTLALNIEQVCYTVLYFVNSAVNPLNSDSLIMRQVPLKMAPISIQILTVLRFP